MEFAFLDESGDPGKKGSKNLILVLAITRQKKKINKIIRDAKKRLLSNNKCARWLNRNNEIKFYNFPDEHLLKKTLKKLAGLDIKVYCSVLPKNKKSVDTKTKEKIIGDIFYHIHESGHKPKKIIADLGFFNKNKVNTFVLKDYKKEKVNGDKEEVSVDVFRMKGEEFCDYCKDLKNLRDVVQIEHQNSRLFEELQALDLICGSLFQHFENKNSSFYNILEKGNIEIKARKIKRN